MEADNFRNLHMISSELRQINAFTANTDFEEFAFNRMKYYAVAMAFINVGEHVKRLSNSFVAKNKEVAWSEWARFRDVIAHNFAACRHSDMWCVVTTEVPPFRLQILRLLSEME